MIRFWKNNNRYIITGTFFCCLFVMGVNVWAQPLTDSNDMALFGKAKSQNNLNQFDQSIPTLKSLHEKYPRNADVLVEYTRALSAGEGGKNAKVLLKALIDDYVVEDYSEETTIRLIESMVQLRWYQQAAELCRKFLDVTPENQEVRLWLARVLGWDRHYQESIDVYNQILDAPSPLKDKGLYREKARVLGWARDYDGSLQAYQEALEENPGEALEREMQAKKNFYRAYERNAAKEYEQLLTIESDNLEAQFDLAQIYSRQKRWSKAGMLYQKILKQLPDHPQAQSAYEHLQWLQKGKSMQTGFIMTEADSGARLTDKRLYSLYEQFSFPVGDEARAFFRHTDDLYNFYDLSAVQGHSYALSGEFFPSELFETSAGYTYTHYSDDIKGSHNVFADVLLKPLDTFNMRVGYQRRNVIENSTSLKNGLRKDDVNLRLELQPHPDVEMGVNAGLAHYSDSNDQTTYSTDLAYHYFCSPVRLTFQYKYETYGFDHPSVQYFSPSSFHFNEVGIELQHFLNVDELFWGGVSSFYTAGYAVNFDGKDQTGHHLYTDFHKDWNSSFSTTLEWSKKIYEHRKLYSEDTLTMNGILRF